MSLRSVVPEVVPGKETDIDEFDVDPQTPYQQLIVWDPQEQEIIGGYRYILCDHLSFNAEGEPNLATTELFRFSDQFKSGLPASRK